MVLNKVVKVDVDGVLRDMIAKCCDIYNEHFSEKYGEIHEQDVTEYNIDNIFKGILVEEGMLPWEYFFLYKGNDVFLRSGMLFEAKHAIDTLKKNGFRIVIVTFQLNHVNRMSTLQWLENNGIEYDDICFTKDKWLVKGDYIIDDNPSFLLDERENADKILVSQPYNKHITEKQCTIVENIHEAVDYIIAKELKDTYC